MSVATSIHQSESAARLRPDAEPAPPAPAGSAAEAPLARETPQNIVWLASYPKSGNTWVRALLGNLNRELDADPIDINHLKEGIGFEVRAVHYAHLLGKPASEASPLEIAQVRSQAQAEIAASRTQPFLVKTHLALGKCDNAPLINLDATLAAVYIVRNPLDVAISYAHHSAVSIDTMIQCMATSGQSTPGRNSSVYEVLGSWSEHVASWIGLASRPVLILRYEDLLANSLRSVSSLAHFLGLQSTEVQLRAAIAKSSFSELRRQEAENGFRERSSRAKVFFREGRAGQWRDVLTEQQIAEIVRVHEPMMQRFGYLPPRAGARVWLGPLGDRPATIRPVTG